MKQASNAIKSFALSSPRHHSIPQRKAFSKYLFVLLLAGIAMVITSCQKEDHQKKPVPFKATYQNTSAPVSPTQERITGTGTGTHIGKSTFFADVFFDDATGSLYGTSILTAANGDQIFSTFTGAFVDPDKNGNLYPTTTNTITGGTGRFEGATGSYIGHVTASIYSTASNVTFEGTITY